MPVTVLQPIRVQQWFRWALFLALVPGLLCGQETGSTGSATAELDTLVVVASKSPRPLSEVPAQVSVIDGTDISERLVEDLDGLLRYEPGVEVETAGTRFGAAGINIRGIGGNRVAIEQDGVPVRDRFSVGAFSDAGRALVETDRIKRVEILHGPASVMYGSNALGGVVAITTWDPDDLLADAAGNHSVSLRGGYQGADDSFAGSALLAAGRDEHGMLLAATWREGHELDNQAPDTLPDDPQDWTSRDAMLRYTWDSPLGNRLRLTAAGQESEAETQIFSLLGYGRRFRTTTALRGEDEDRYHRLVADWEFDWGGWEQGLARVFRTTYETEQLTLEERRTARPPLALERRFEYEQQHSGVDFSLFRELRQGGVLHRIGLGLEWLQTETSELRDGLQTNLDTGTSTTVVLGESMPVRDFPNSRSREFGLWAQDEVSLGSRWELIPALRWDHYRLDPDPDALWLEDYPDTEVVEVSEQDLTPRLGLLYHTSQDWSVYGQYSRGFRAPPFEDANIGLDNPLLGFRAIPNPDLKSETSDGIELGLHRVAGGSSFHLALFHTDYDDFIETRALIGTDPETGDLIFQSRNIGRASIQGLDISWEQALEHWSAALARWRLQAAGYWSDGKNRDTGQPLNSIAPPQAVVGLTWASADGAWDCSMTATLTAAKDEGDIDQSASPRYPTAGWGVLDFSAGWRPTAGLELRAGLFNAGDKTYWRWLDVANLDPTDPMIALLSRPGRHFSVTARIAF